MRLEGKVVVITGAGSGMGAAMARLFAAEGAKVVGGDVAAARLEAVAKEVTEAGGAMTAKVTDVTDKEQAEGLITAAIDGYGSLDVLVNNAGIMDQFQGVAKVTDQLWDKVMSVNLYAPMVLSRAAVQYMLEHGGGAILNIASAAGVGGGSAGATYTVSKHGVIGLTRNTAVTYASKGIRCNAIVVGAVATNIGESIDPSRIDQDAMGVYGRWHAMAPAMLQPESVAQLGLFLVSDEAKMINGALVNADGGWGSY